MTFEYKKCPKCLEEKSISSFAKDKSKKSGKCVWCKSCMNICRKQNYKKQIIKGFIAKDKTEKWRSENKDKLKEQRKREYRKNSLNITNRYVLTQLKINKSDASQEIIDIKREQIRIFRLAKQLKQELQNV